MGLIIDLVVNLLRLLGNLLVRLAGRPPDYVLLDLAGAYPERRTPRPRFLPFRGVLPFGLPAPEESLEELREVLDRLARAPRVRGVVVRLGELSAGLATAQSLRAALQDLRRRGKRVVAYLTSVSTLQYYLATAADEILLPESAVVALTGLRTEVTFLRDVFDRLGIAPEFDRIAEYKTAADPFLRRSMSPAHREMLDAILDGLLEEIVADVAAARGLEAAAVRTAVNRAPLPAAEALGLGLVDGLLYEDELPRRLGTAWREAVLRPWVAARRRIPFPYRWPSLQDVVAVVVLRGMIVPGESREFPVSLPLVGRHLSGSSTVARAFRAVERARRVRAVVFYVDSRGGSALASDLIWREVERVKRQKPVVVYMGDVAGSGGYYVACGASRVIAQPAAITGSIGVVVGKLVLADLFRRHGLNREILTRGAAAAITSPFSRYSEEEWARVRREMQDIYRRFIGRVSQGRARAMEEVEGVAGGRVWTGRQALARGLVDELGDFTLAVRRARELAGIPPQREVAVVTVRPPRAAGIPAFPTTPAEMIKGLRQVAALAAERALLLMALP
ncbi:MAG: signal peptide peptidase SppA [Armatimonadota bacterium]|nr:signal peptide peptidase SppA [Armatimonadota bacterium]MDR7426085.1 signal peptide peptidase SppA [Armatimonadota bacterium]MDR7464423.1 signal peptide peptidase SppA [Armatimonadota bacterium]MDR7469084.1 signal peptide peptidase SppA [Armatimonadota bacterium]MDR7474286.1 signal peptide peptidase SppA [Armatimonadota bacterium]